MRVFALALLLITTPALADGDFTGRWAENESQCTGQPDIPPVEITGSTYKGYEQTCVFENVATTIVAGEPVWWTVRMQCKGEGMEETTISEFMTNNDGNTLFETPIAADGTRGETIARSRCSWD